MNFEWLTSLLQASPPIALALAINLILFWLRKTPLPGWSRPLVAMGAGGATYPFLVEVGKVAYEVRSPLLYSVILGVCIGGLSVSFNQVIKQWLKDHGADPMNGDTDTVTKPDVNGPDL